MNTIASLLPRFFTDRMQTQRRASSHTIAAYRDTFRLLIVLRRSGSRRSLSHCWLRILVRN